MKKLILMLAILLAFNATISAQTARTRTTTTTERSAKVVIPAPRPIVVQSKVIKHKPRHHRAVVKKRRVRPVRSQPAVIERRIVVPTP